MKVFLDFDGVILDTDSAIDLEFDGNGSRGDFIKNYDWFKLMRDDLIINRAFDYIKNSKYSVNLLSKFCSICECQAKIKYLRKNEVNIDINLVPTLINKCDVVSAFGNVLIDDKVSNLDSWSERGGISIFFNKDSKDTDIHGVRNTLYPMISDLSCLVNGIEDIIKKRG